MRGLILEGVTASGKSTLLHELQLLLAQQRPHCTRLFLSEHYTERVLEDRKAARELSVAAVIEHLGRVVDLVRSLAAFQQGSKFDGRGGNASILVLLERFAGGHAANLSRLAPSLWNPSSTQQQAIVDLYETLRGLGVSPVLLCLDEGAMAGALRSTRQHRNPAWSEFLDLLGDEAAVLSHFLAWQQEIERFYAGLPTSLQPRRIEIADSSNREVLRRWAERLATEELG